MIELSECPKMSFLANIFSANSDEVQVQSNSRGSIPPPTQWAKSVLNVQYAQAL